MTYVSQAVQAALFDDVLEAYLEYENGPNVDADETREFAQKVENIVYTYRKIAAAG